MKKNVKVILFGLVFVLGSFFLMYGVIIPSAIKSKVPNMERYLSDNGYKNTKVTNISASTYTVTFDSNKGQVKVRFSHNGLFQIVY